VFTGRITSRLLHVGGEGLAARAVDRVPLADGKKTHTALWCPVVFLFLHLPFYLIMVGGLLAKKSELFSPNFDFNFCF